MDENVTDSSAVENTEAGSDTSADTSAGTENTAGGQEHMIPKSRFDEVNARMKEAEQKSRELEEQLQEAASSAEKDAERQTATDLTEEPPAGLDARARARWFIERDSEALIQRKLGMSLEEASTLLKTAAAATKTTQQREWERMCGEHGLDPKNREVQEFVYGLTQAKVPADEVMKRASRLYGTKKEQTHRDTADVEESGVSSTMSRSVVVPKTREEARDLARQGVRASFVSSQSLINKAVEQMNKRDGPRTRSTQ